MQFSDPAHCSWTWKRLPIDSSSNLTNVSSSMVYWTSDNDLGHQLEIECIPQDHNGRSGEPFSVTTAPVLPSPSLSAITLRHQHTQQCLSSQDELRVVSYNILAEYYSSTDYAHHVKYPALSAVCNDIYLIRKSYSLQNKAMLICFKTKSLYSQRAVLSNVLFVQWRMH